MLLELTSAENFPVFVSVDSIEYIEQHEDGTCLCTKSGQTLFVKESAAEIKLELMAIQEETMLQMVGMQ